MMRLKRVVFLTLIILCISSINYLYAFERLNIRDFYKKRIRSITIYGKVTDKANSKPIANAEVYFQAQNVFQKVLSNDTGDYRIHFETRLEFRSGKIVVSAEEYKKENKFLFISSGNNTININFKLRDVTRPILEIVSPAEGEEIFSNPTIEVRYQDYGSGIDKASIKIFANNKSLTEYIQTIDDQKVICIVPQDNPLSSGSCRISAQIRDFAGNISIDRVWVIVISSTADYFINLGKEALLKQDILSAHLYFKQALDIAVDSPEANFYYAFTRLAGLLLKEPVFNLLQDMGFRGPHREPLAPNHLDPFNFKIIFPPPTDRGELSASFPGGQKFQEIIKYEIIPEIEQALQNLAFVKKDFISYLALENPLTGREKIEIDYGDVAMLKSIIYAIRAKMHGILVRELGCNLSELSYLLNKGLLTPEYILEQYPQLLGVREVPQSLEERDAFVSAINNYLEAFNFMEAEADEQSDDLISLSRIPQHREDGGLLNEQIKDVRKSLLSQPDSEFSIKLSQFINLGQFFTNPFDPREMLGTECVPYLLRDNFLPHLDYILGNFSKANINYQEYFPPHHNLYKGEIKDVDFADISAGKFTFEFMRMNFLGLLGYDFNLDVQEIALNTMRDKNNRHLSFNDILDAYPNLLNLSEENNIDFARESFNGIVRTYKETVDYLLHCEDAHQLDDVLVPPDYFWRNESRYRMLLDGLNSMQSTLVDPALSITTNSFYLNLGEFFVHHKDLRQFLPEFDQDDNRIPGSWPDVTFGGIYPNNESQE